MRSLVGQRQRVWFCKYTERNSGLDVVREYTKPEGHWFTVSPPGGNAAAGVYTEGEGFVLDYDRRITSFETGFTAEEGDQVFVDVVPQLDSEGYLVLDENDEPVTMPDYIVSRASVTGRGWVGQYALTKL